MKVTHGQIGDDYIKRYGSQRMFALDKWWKWDQFVWLPMDPAEIDREIWDTVRGFEPVPYEQKPTLATVTSVFHYLQSRLYVRSEDLEFGQSVYHICMKNGIYDLRTDALMPARPEYHFTRHLGFSYEPAARCPLWEKFLRDTLVNSSRDYTADLELISFIQEAIGYSLTADVSFHKTFWLFGDEGTGKSTLLYVLEHLLGPSAIPFSLRMLNHDAYQLAELPGIKVLFSTEISRNTRLETDVINSLVSGDTMIARNPYGRPFRLLPRAKIWWAMNYHPSAVNQIEGLGRRLYIVPFHRRFHGTADEVKDLKSLIVGQELPGIFNWALVGLRRLQVNQGFTQSRQIAEETDEFKLANDPPRMFILEMCDVDPNFSVAASDLYDAYRTWCITNGFTPQSIKSVSQDWRRMGFEKQKTKHYNRYLGLQLKP